MKSLNIIKTNLIKVIRILYNKNFFPASSGNISFKLDKKTILITPTQRSKIFLTEDDFSIIDLDGNILNNIKPSSEYRLHINVFKYCESAKVVIHSHPMYATLLSLYNLDIKDFNNKMLYETKYNLNEVALIGYKQSGSKELAESFIKYLKKGIFSYIIKSHGILVYADNIEKALNLSESLEFYSFVYFNRYIK